MTPTEALALMDEGRLALYQEVEVDTADGTVVGRLADVDTHHLWVDLDEDEYGVQDEPWSTALSIVTDLRRVVVRRFPWDPRLEQVWPPVA